MFDRLINEIRQALPPPPRTWPPDADHLVAPRPPLWSKLRINEPLLAQYGYHGLLFSEGSISWGALVQANENLFSRGWVSAYAALVLFSPDPCFDRELEELSRLSDTVFDLKEYRQQEPHRRLISAQLKDEYGRHGRQGLPEDMTGGRQVFIADVMIHRKHLPRGYLEGFVFPILHHSSTEFISLLPSRFWPQEFIEIWDSIG